MAHFFIVLILFSLSFSQDFFSRTQTSAEIANEYIQAYSATDFKKMATFYTDSSRFADFTATDAFTENYDVTGKDILPTFQKAFRNLEHFNIQVDRTFSSGSFTLFEGSCSYQYKLKNRKALINHPFTVIVTVKNGKVVEHLDFADYATMQRQIAPEKPIDTSKFTSKNAMNFRLGTWAWQAEALAPNGMKVSGIGTSTTRYINSGKAILDETKIVYDGNFVYEAITYRTYNPQSNSWLIVWAQANTAQSLQIEGRWQKDRFVEINKGTDEKGDWVNQLEVTNINERSYKGTLTRTYSNGIPLFQFSYIATKISR